MGRQSGEIVGRLSGDGREMSIPYNTNRLRNDSQTMRPEADETSPATLGGMSPTMSRPLLWCGIPAIHHVQAPPTFSNRPGQSAPQLRATIRADDLGTIGFRNRRKFPEMLGFERLSDHSGVRIGVIVPRSWAQW